MLRQLIDECKMIAFVFVLLLLIPAWASQDDTIPFRTLRQQHMEDQLQQLRQEQELYAQNLELKQEKQKLAADWWQWFISIPRSENPFAPNQSDVNVNKHIYQNQGNIYFLSGGYYNTPNIEQRNITIKKDIPIFFPVVCQGVTFNPTVWDILRGVKAEDSLKKSLKVFAATYVEVTLDNQTLKYQRIYSPVFEATYNKDHFYAPNNSTFTGPTMVDGFWTYLPSLSVGHHLLEIRGAYAGYYTFVDYSIEVVPK